MGKLTTVNGSVVVEMDREVISYGDPLDPCSVLTLPTGVILYKIDGEWWYYFKGKPLEPENPHGEILCQN